MVFSAVVALGLLGGAQLLVDLSRVLWVERLHHLPEGTTRFGDSHALLVELDADEAHGRRIAQPEVEVEAPRSGLRFQADSSFWVAPRWSLTIFSMSSSKTGSAKGVSTWHVPAA